MYLKIFGFLQGSDNHSSEVTIINNFNLINAIYGPTVNLWSYCKKK